MSRKNIFYVYRNQVYMNQESSEPLKKNPASCNAFHWGRLTAKMKFFYILCQLKYSGKNYQSEAEDLRVVNTLAPRNYRNSD